MNTQTTGTPEQKQKILVKALLNPACYPHAVENIKMIETHISYVFLTGSYWNPNVILYLEKKPVTKDCY